MKPKPISFQALDRRSAIRLNPGLAIVFGFLLLLVPQTHFAQVIAPVLDYGDAPAPYPTKLAQDGARHVISSRIFLGKAIDAEADGLPSALADGDNLSSANNVNDED